MNKFWRSNVQHAAAAAAAKSLQSCPTLCDPIDGNPKGSAIPGILQARILEWVAISFFNAWKWKVKVKSLSCLTQRPHGLQRTRLLCPWDFPGKSTGVGCHCLLREESRGLHIYQYLQVSLPLLGLGHHHGNLSEPGCEWAGRDSWKGAELT